MQPNYVHIKHASSAQKYGSRVRDAGKTWAIILSMRSLCWQMKERDNELTLEHHLSENGQLLTVDNTAPGRHK